MIATAEYRGRSWRDVNLRRVFNRIRNWTWSSQLRQADDGEQGHGNQLLIARWLGGEIRVSEDSASGSLSAISLSKGN